MKNRFYLGMGILVSAFILAFLCVGPAQQGPTEKIAKKMAPRDATGDLEKVQGQEEETEKKEAKEAGEEKEKLTQVQLLTLPRGQQIKRESDEPEVPVNILEDPQVRSLLNPSPSFVYDPGELKDPMIVPWVLNEILVKELLEDLGKKVKEAEYNHRKIPEALSLIKQIDEILPGLSDIQLRNTSEKRLEEYRIELSSIPTKDKDNDQIVPTLTPLPTPDGIVIPPWIKGNFRGVIWQPKAEERLALIGDEILREGNKIPRYPDAVVQKINPNSVVITYRGLTEEIRVEKE